MTDELASHNGKCPCTARLVVRWPDGREERPCLKHAGVVLHQVLGADPAGASHADVFLLTDRHAQQCEVDAQTPVVDTEWPGDTIRP